MKNLFKIKDPYENPMDIAQSIVKTVTEEFNLNDQNTILNTINTAIIERRRVAIQRNTEALEEFLKQLKEYETNQR